MNASPASLFFEAIDPSAAPIVVIPVPFDATCSFRRGSARGPEAIRLASPQCDEVDASFGVIDSPGAGWLAPPAWIAEESHRVGKLAQPIVDQGAARPEDASALAEINQASARVNEYVRSAAAGVLARGAIPALIGGEHSVSLGGIEACAAAVPSLGMLQIDAHMDLRRSYLGMEQSHASVMDNALRRCANISTLVQIGIRDFGTEEKARVEELGGRVRTHFDDALRIGPGDGGSRWREILEPLPEAIYLTVDIDGLDPSLCPDTGTPVPGGLTWRELTSLLAAVRDSGRRVVGFDLVEVAPGRTTMPDLYHEDFNAIVGARVLQRLCVVARATQPS